MDLLKILHWLLLIMFKELQETMSKELMENTRIMYHQMENINRKTDLKKTNRNSGSVKRSN